MNGLFYDKPLPVICVDELPKHLMSIVHYRAADGRRMKDSGYVPHGAGQTYRAFQPLAGQRLVEVNDDHKAITWVGAIAGLLDGPHEKWLKMTVVSDSLTGPPVGCPKPGAFYTVCGPAQAKAYLDRLEFVYTTPAGGAKDGSWLEMAQRGGRSP